MCILLVSNDKSCLMMAQDRVAPLKVQTIQTLEQMASVLGSRPQDHIIKTVRTANLYYGVIVR